MAVSTAAIAGKPAPTPNALADDYPLPRQTAHTHQRHRIRPKANDCIPAHHLDVIAVIGAARHVVEHQLVRRLVANHPVVAKLPAEQKRVMPAAVADRVIAFAAFDKVYAPAALDQVVTVAADDEGIALCLLYTSPSPRD